MSLEVFPGETVRVTAKDLSHVDLGSITSAADVTITLYTWAGVVVDSGTAATGGSGDDWYVDFDMPVTTGRYRVKVVAIVSGATWMDESTIKVVPF